jgi:hypothetical protein
MPTQPATYAALRLRWKGQGVIPSVALMRFTQCAHVRFRYEYSGPTTIPTQPATYAALRLHYARSSRGEG